MTEVGGAHDHAIFLGDGAADGATDHDFTLACGEGFSSQNGHSQEGADRETAKRVARGSARELHEPGALPVYEGKAKRVIDDRPKD